MPLSSSYTTPAATVTTTSETLAANIPVTPFAPANNQTGVIIRGNVIITTGTAVTSVTVKLRAGQNNTSTAQVDQSETVIGAASLANLEVPFEFIDTSTPVGGNLVSTGYSITVIQNGATGNGTIVAVNFETDRSPV